MVKAIAAVVASAVILFPIASIAHGGHRGGHRSSHTSGGVTHVSTYTMKDGKVVEAHDRTAEGGPQHNNWSTKGNVNPETGKKGDKAVEDDH